VIFGLFFRIDKISDGHQCTEQNRCVVYGHLFIITDNVVDEYAAEFGTVDECQHLLATLYSFDGR
jgi:hypothetical protein